MVNQGGQEGALAERRYGDGADLGEGRVEVPVVLEPLDAFLCGVYRVEATPNVNVSIIARAGEREGERLTVRTRIP